MVNAYYFDRGTRKLFLSTIKIFLKDIKRLERERKRFLANYSKNPKIENMSHFYHIAKRIEQMLILGICGEYLIKCVLIKHSFIINKLEKNTRFSDEFIVKLEALNNSGLKTTYDKIEEVKNLSEKNLIASLSDDTITFDDCIQIFKKEILDKDISYFQNTPKYDIFNLGTQEFYDKKQVGYSDGFRLLQKIRNNYGHMPEPKYEEDGILPYLYDFVVFMSKKEFSDFFNSTNYFNEV